MSDKEPTSTFDVIIHDKYQYVCRVAFFGDLSEEWLEKWRGTFYDIPDMEGHAVHIALALHHDRLQTFVEGYGPALWLEKSWRRVAIWDAQGKEVSHAAIKLLDASMPTSRYDYNTVSSAEWEGFDVRIGK